MAATWPLLLYVAGVLAVLAAGKWTKRQSTPTAREEALGTSKFGTLVITMTLVATILGPADTLALADQGKKYGFFFLLFPLCAAVQHFITGTFFAAKINNQAADCVTVGDIMSKHYGRTAKLFAGLVTVAQAIAFSGVLALAGGQVLQAFLGWPLDYGILATAAFVGLYTTVGGMNAVIRTDRIQFCLLVCLGSCAVVAALLLLGRNSAEVPQTWFWRPDPTEFSATTIASIAVAYFLGEALLPIYAVRGLIAATPRQAARAFQCSALIIALWYFGMVTIGVSGNLLTESTSKTDYVFVDVLASLGTTATVQAFLAALALVGILALVHSTFDSILNAGASAFARDVLGSFAELSDASERAFMKRAVMIIAVAGTAISMVKADLIEILLIGYTIWVPTMVFPLAYAIVRGRPANQPWSGVAAITAGVAAYFIWKQSPPIPIPEIVVGLLANALTLFALEWLTPARPASARVTVPP